MTRVTRTARTPLHHRRPPQVGSRVGRPQDGRPLLHSRLPWLMVVVLRVTIHLGRSGSSTPRLTLNHKQRHKDDRRMDLPTGERVTRRMNR